MHLGRKAILLVVVVVGWPPLPRAHSSEGPDPHPHVALATLDADARRLLSAKARVELGPVHSGLVASADSLEPAAAGHVPNYLLALQDRPGASQALAHLVRTVLYAGTLEPEIKMGMGLRVAQLNSSPYVAAHLERLLRSSSRGRTVLEAIASESLDSLSPDERLALQYADWLSPNVHGVTEDNFRAAREYFNDSQVVELTAIVSFFDYFTRFAEGLNLPVEPWVLDSPAHPAAPEYVPPQARVGLISDEEIQATTARAAAMKAAGDPAKSWGIGFPNSMRAMYRTPEIAQAWFDYGNTLRKSEAASRDIMLQVSLAVSEANNCHY